MRYLSVIFVLLLCSCAGSPRDPQGALPKAQAYIFIQHDCPICNSYAPEIRRLCEQFPQVPFKLVYEDQDTSVQQLRKHAEQYRFGCPIATDPEHVLAHQFGVVTVPTAVIVGPGGAVAYRGRIDDQYLALGRQRAQATQHEFHDALLAISQDRPVAVAQTPAVGCSIE